AAEELLVDEVGDARFLRAGPELVRGDEPRHRRVEERDLGGPEKHVFLALRGAVRVLLRDGAGWHGGAERADRFQETPPTFGFVHASSPGCARTNSSVRPNQRKGAASQRALFRARNWTAG